MRHGGHVLIADDHPLFREGLSLAVRNAMSGSTIVAAGSVAEAVAAADLRGAFRMILIDLQLPDARGYSGLLALQFRVPRAPIVVIADRDDPSLVEAARALGAAGYLSKRAPLDEMADNLRNIDAGRSCFPAAGAASPSIDNARQRISALSPAQHKVLLSLADGRSNKRIARELDITEATVKAHLTAIFRKMGVDNRTQALLAIQPLVGTMAS